MTYDPSARQHATYSPSSAERIKACPGSVRLCASGPSLPPSQYAIEGQYADEVLMYALDNRIWNARAAHVQMPGDAPSWFDEEQEWATSFYRSIQVALDYVKEITETEPDCLVLTQEKVHPPSDAAPGDTFGYLDIRIITNAFTDRAPRKLYIIDYKHGAGIVVEVEENSQLLQYGAGALYNPDDLTYPQAIMQYTEVVYVIVQPRAFHKDGPIREWRTYPFRAYEHTMEFDEYIYEAQKDSAYLKAGEHCRFCDARFRCPEREKAAVSVAASHFENIHDVTEPSLPLVDTMEVERLAYIRAKAPMLRKFLDEVDERLTDLAKKGVHIPGAKLVAPQARRRYFHDEEETLEQLEALTELPREALTKTRVVPLTYAEELVVEAYKKHAGHGKKKAAASAAKEAFALLTIKDSVGAPILVDADDPRPALNRAEVFAQLKTIEPPPKGKGK